MLRVLVARHVIRSSGGGNGSTFGKSTPADRRAGDGAPESATAVCPRLARSSGQRNGKRWLRLSRPRRCTAWKPRGNSYSVCTPIGSCAVCVSGRARVRSHTRRLSRVRSRNLLKPNCRSGCPKPLSGTRSGIAWSVTSPATPLPLKPANASKDSPSTNRSRNANEVAHASPNAHFPGRRLPRQRRQTLSEVLEELLRHCSLGPRRPVRGIGNTGAVTNYIWMWPVGRSRSLACSPPLRCTIRKLLFRWPPLRHRALPRSTS